MKVAGDYLGAESLIFFPMETWSCHIDRFKRKYDNAFAKDSLLWADLMDCIHNHVQVILHSCNTTTIEDDELGALA